MMFLFLILLVFLPNSAPGVAGNASSTQSPLFALASEKRRSVALFCVCPLKPIASTQLPLSSINSFGATDRGLTNWHQFQILAVEEATSRVPPDWPGVNLQDRDDGGLPPGVLQEKGWKKRRL